MGASSIQPDNSIIVLTRAHERFYEPQLDDFPLRRRVVQLSNRGTAPAVLYSLFRLAAMAPEASVALFPSDHYVENGCGFMRHVDSAFDTISRAPGTYRTSRDRTGERGDRLRMDRTPPAAFGRRVSSLSREALYREPRLELAKELQGRENHEDRRPFALGGLSGLATRV